MNCPNCGAELNEGVKFCKYCGAEIAESAQPVQEAAPADYTSRDYQSAQPARKQGFFSKKKNIIIVAVAAVLVIAGGVFGAFALFGGNGIKDNPTAYVGKSFWNFFESVYKDSDVYNVVKDADKKGTLSVGLTEGNNIDVGIDVGLDYAFDTASGEAYAKLEGNMEGVNGNIELYSDSKRLNARYDANGESGSYYISLDNLKEDLEKSIFSPKGENVFNISQEDFDKAVNSIDKIFNYVDNPAEMKQSLEKHIKNVIKSVETNGKVEVADEKVVVNGKEIDTNTVTYTFDGKSFKKLTEDVVAELKAYRDELDVEDDGNGSFLDEIEYNGSDSIVMTYKFCVAKGTDQIAKVDIGWKDGDENGGGYVEFSNGENGMSIAYTDGDNSLFVTRKPNGGKIVYEIGAIDDSFMLTFDKSAKTLVVQSAQDSQPFEITLGYDVTENSVMLKAPASALGDGSPEIRLVFSNITDIQKFTGEENILSLSKEDFAKLFGASSAAAEQGGGTVIDESTLYGGDNDDSDKTESDDDDISGSIGEEADDFDDNDPIYGKDTWDEESGEEPDEADEEEIIDSDEELSDEDIKDLEDLLKGIESAEE